MESANIYYPYRIYQNIIKFLEYRRLDYKANVGAHEHKKSKTILGYEEFVNDIQYEGYIMIQARDRSDKERRFYKKISDENKKREVITYVVLLNKETEYAEKSDKMEKLMQRVPSFTNKIRDFNLDIIIVSYAKLNLHLIKKIDSLVDRGEADDTGFIHIHNYKYACFALELPKYKYNPPVRIVPKDEEKKILAELNVTRENLKRICKSDPLCVWYGGEFGDILEMQVPSETAGVKPIYCVVRP